ncbi:MAG: protocatechuate 3,4-dioxygenase subunit alpha [Geminicoccaceae bacterium]
MMPAAAGLDVAWGQGWNVLAGPETQGQRIRLEGIILDGTDSVVRDAMIEIWQADGHGRYPHPEDRQDKPGDGNFHGFGRTVADLQTGLWWFDTVKPGAVQGRHGTEMAPHVNVAIFARGINIQLNTRIYFADEAEANAKDPVLRLVEQEKRRDTLLARLEERQEQPVYRFTVHLQGEQETVFFDV